MVVGETYLSLLTRSLWGRVAVLAVCGLLGLTGVLVVWTLVANRQPPTDTKPNEEIAKTGAVNPQSADPNAKPPAKFNRRWLPEQTRLLIDLRLSRLAKQPPALNSLAFLGGWWQPSSRRYWTHSALVPSKSAM